MSTSEVFPVYDVVDALIALVEPPETTGKAFNVAWRRSRCSTWRVGWLISRAARELRLLPCDEAYGAGFEHMGPL